MSFPGTNLFKVTLQKSKPTHPFCCCTSSKTERKARTRKTGTRHLSIFSVSHWRGLLLIVRRLCAQKCCVQVQIWELEQKYRSQPGNCFPPTEKKEILKFLLTKCVCYWIVLTKKASILTYNTVLITTDRNTVNKTHSQMFICCGKKTFSDKRNPHSGLMLSSTTVHWNSSYQDKLHWSADPSFFTTFSICVNSTLY